MEEFIARRVGARVVRAQTLADGEPVYLHLEGGGVCVEGELVGLRVHRRWTLGGVRHAAGPILRTRVDVAALGLEPRILEERDRGAYAFQTSPVERVLQRYLEDAADRIRMGRAGEAAARLHRLLDAEPACVDAYNHLGLLAEREGDIDRARRYYRLAYAIGRYGLPRELPGPLPWRYPPNRPFLRAVHGYGLQLWRLGKRTQAAGLLRELLALDEEDPFGVESLLEDIEAGLSPWAEVSV